MGSVVRDPRNLEENSVKRYNGFGNTAFKLWLSANYRWLDLYQIYTLTTRLWLPPWSFSSKNSWKKLLLLHVYRHHMTPCGPHSNVAVGPFPQSWSLVIACARVCCIICICDTKYLSFPLTMYLCLPFNTYIVLVFSAHLVLVHSNYKSILISIYHAFISCLVHLQCTTHISINHALLSCILCTWNVSLNHMPATYRMCRPLRYMWQSSLVNCLISVVYTGQARYLPLLSNQHYTNIHFLRMEYRANNERNK